MGTVCHHSRVFWTKGGREERESPVTPSRNGPSYTLDVRSRRGGGVVERSLAGRVRRGRGGGREVG